MQFLGISENDDREDEQTHTTADILKIEQNSATIINHKEHVVIEDITAEQSRQDSKPQIIRECPADYGQQRVGNCQQGDEKHIQDSAVWHVPSHALPYDSRGEEGENGREHFKLDEQLPEQPVHTPGHCLEITDSNRTHPQDHEINDKGYDQKHQGQYRHPGRLKLTPDQCQQDILKIIISSFSLNILGDKHKRILGEWGYCCHLTNEAQREVDPSWKLRP